MVDFSLEWGIDSELLGKSVELYSHSEPKVVPYIDEIFSSVVFSKATNQTAGNVLKHNLNLTNELPVWIAKIKQKYS